MVIKSQGLKRRSKKNNDKFFFSGDHYSFHLWCAFINFHHHQQHWWHQRTIACSVGSWIPDWRSLTNHVSRSVYRYKFPSLHCMSIAYSTRGNGCGSSILTNHWLRIVCSLPLLPTCLPLQSLLYSPSCCVLCKQPTTRSTTDLGSQPVPPPPELDNWTSVTSKDQQQNDGGSETCPHWEGAELLQAIQGPTWRTAEVVGQSVYGGVESLR